MSAKQTNDGGNKRKKRAEEKVVEEEDKDKEEEEGEQPLTLLDLPANVRQLIWKNAMNSYNDKSCELEDIQTGIHIGLVSWVELDASVCECFLFSPLPSLLISPHLISNTNTDLQKFL